MHSYAVVLFNSLIWIGIWTHIQDRNALISEGDVRIEVLVHFVLQRVCPQVDQTSARSGKTAELIRTTGLQAAPVTEKPEQR